MNLDTDLSIQDNLWKRSQAISICKQIEDICPAFGYHVALTGGCLYKSGYRKDLDIIFYTIRQEKDDRAGLEKALSNVGIRVVGRFGWMSKGVFQPEKSDLIKKIDIFFPETLKTSTNLYDEIIDFR